MHFPKINLFQTKNTDGLQPSSFSLLQRAGRDVWALLGTSGPILSSSIQKYNYYIRENSGALRPPSFLLLRRAGRALQALLGTSGPILSSSIQKYTYNICRSK